MSKYEQVVNGIECCACNKTENESCCVCPYTDSPNSCIDELLKDALELLKEQQAIIERYHKADVFLEVHGFKWKDGEQE